MLAALLQGMQQQRKACLNANSGTAQLPGWHPKTSGGVIRPCTLAGTAECITNSPKGAQAPLNE